MPLKIVGRHNSVHCTQTSCMWFELRSSIHTPLLKSTGFTVSRSDVVAGLWDGQGGAGTITPWSGDQLAMCDLGEGREWSW